MEAVSLIRRLLTPGLQERDQAEYMRLLEEMRQRSKKNIWQGVEDAYGQILDLRGVNIEAEVYDLGSQAARGLGDILSQYERVKLMLASGPTSTQEIVATQTIIEIEKNYGRVEIKLPANDNTACQLNPRERPFAPGQRYAIEFAQKQLQEYGRFDGLLPVEAGPYTLTTGEGEVSPEQFTATSIHDKGDDSVAVSIDLKVREKRERVAFRIPDGVKDHFYPDLTLGGGRLTLDNGNAYNGLSGSVGVAGYWDFLFADRFGFRFRGDVDLGGQALSHDDGNFRTGYVQEGAGVDLLWGVSGLDFTTGAGVGLRQYPFAAGDLHIGSAQVSLTNPALTFSPVGSAQILVGRRGAGWQAGVEGNLTGQNEIYGDLAEYQITGVSAEPINAAMTVKLIHRGRK